MQGCPKDSTPLTVHTVQNHNVFHCNSCSGLWLPTNVVQAAMGKVPTSTSTRSQTLLCPDDTAALIPIRHHDIVIDLCSQCGGVWLDYGELEHILNKQRRSQTSGERSGPQIKLEKAGRDRVKSHTDSAVFEVAGEAFSLIFEFLGDISIDL